MCIRLHVYWVSILLTATLGAATARAQSPSAPPPTESVAPAIEITASADASAAGLEPAFAGGQVASGGRIGVLGNMNYMDTPFNSMNYTHELIQDQQARGVADVLLNDPSVRVARGFGNFQELYVIRGFPIASDDMAYNGLYGILPRQFVATELLERVEVLRGANSFMNGAAPGGGSVGGAINLLPKRAPNDPLTQFTVGVESGAQAYAAGDVARRFGPDQSAGLRMNVALRQGDTAVEDEYRSLGVFSIGFDYRGSGFRLSADLGYQDHKLDAPRPSVTPGFGIPIAAPPEASSNFAQLWTYSNERDTFGTIRGEVDLGSDAVVWGAIGARFGHEANDLANPTLVDANGDTSWYRFINTRDDTVITGEVGIRDKFQTGAVGHTVAAVAAGYGIDSKNAFATSNFLTPLPSSIYGPVFGAPPPANFLIGGNLSSPQTTQRTELRSFAVADTLAFFKERFLLTLGARYQEIDDRGYDYNTGAQNADYDDSAVTPLVAGVVKLSNQFSVYANYAESLAKGPVAQGTNIVNQGEVFAPFRSKQKEVGVKYGGGTLGAALALFSTTQPLSFVENNVFTVSGEQRNQGIELTAFGQPARGVRVLGGVTLLDAKQEKTANGLTDGKDAIGVPTTQINVGGEWDIPGLEKLTLTARAIYSSPQFADAANTQQIASWTRFDIGARYLVPFGQQLLTLRFRVDNVFDRSYWASAGGFPGSNYLVVGAPRTFAATASVDF